MRVLLPRSTDTQLELASRALDECGSHRAEGADAVPWSAPSDRSACLSTRYSCAIQRPARLPRSS